MKLTTLIVTSFVLAVAGCSGDDGSPQPIDAADVDADPNAIDAPAVCSGGTLGYLETCTMVAGECGSCECHSFGHTVVCTTTCTTDADCAAPSAGCTGGFCRR